MELSNLQFTVVFYHFVHLLCTTELQLGAAQGGGALIKSVTAGGPASRAGVYAGDVVKCSDVILHVPRVAQLLVVTARVGRG